MLKYFLNRGVWQGKCLVPPRHAGAVGERKHTEAAPPLPHRFIFHVMAASRLRLQDESVHVTERMDSKLNRQQRSSADRTDQCVSGIISHY